MLRGLHMMDDTAKLAFVEELQLKPGPDHDLTGVLVEWMGRSVGVHSGSPEEVEYAVLLWMAKRFGLEDYSGLPVDQLEAAVRRKVAEDSHNFLFPFMEVGSAIAYLGPRAVVGPKLELLEASTAGLIPSHSARDRMRKYWQERGAKLLSLNETVDPHSLLEYLDEPIEILKKSSPETRAAVLSLSHAMALSDGRFEVEEETFTKALSEALEVPPEKLQQISSKVNEAFWRHLRELEGTTPKERSTGEELSLNLRAAQRALESCGSLASFSEVVERGFVGAIHRGIGERSRKGKGLSLGFATGMLCFIRDRWKSDRQENQALLRLALAAIYQQHLQATAEHAELTPEDVSNYLPRREVENPADILAETVVGKKESGPVRKITLD